MSCCQFPHQLPAPPPCRCVGPEQLISIQRRGTPSEPLVGDGRGIFLEPTRWAQPVGGFAFHESHRLQESRPLLHEEEKVHVLTGLETWFTLPSKPAEPPPPRYKMAMVTWLAVVPVVFVLFSIFGQWLTLLPALLRTLVFSAVTVTLMTYVIMPRMTRLFSFWLYPDRD